MEILIVLFFILFCSFFLSKIFVKLDLPKILAPIVVGILFKLLSVDFIDFNANGISEIAKIASVLILFYVGLELNIKKLKKQRSSTISLALFGFFLTFIPTLIITYYVFNFSFIISFVLASVVSVTAEDLVVVILSDNNKLNSKEGEIIVGAGIIDDVFGILLLAIIPFISNIESSTINITKLIVGFLLCFFGYYSIKGLSKAIDNIFVKKYLIKSYDLFSYSILFLMGVATLFFFLGFDFAIGALIAGFLLNFSLHRANRTGIVEEHRIDNFIKNITFGFLYYFFFFIIGYNVNFEFLFTNYKLGIILVIIGLLGKYLAGIISAKISKLDFKIGNKLGLGMSVKGGMDLIIAEIARQNNLISQEIFSAIVFMSLILMLISTISFKLSLQEKKVHQNLIKKYIDEKYSNKRKTKKIEL